MGTIIKQDNRPVAYYTRKLNSAQKNYTTIEKELLSIVETFREFRSMLLGTKINVNTVHKNLTHRLSQFTTQHVMRWRLLLEEYGPKFFDLKGPHNVVADALSRVPTTAVSSLNHTPTNASIRPLSQPSSVVPCNKTLDKLTIDTLAEGLLAMPACEAHKSEALHSEAVPDPTVLWHDCCLFHPRFDARGNHSFHFSTFNHYQQNDKQLLQTLAQAPGRFFKQPLGGYNIICIRQSPTPNSAWHIIIPDAMLHLLVAWYHEALVHSVGMDRLEAILKRNFWHPNLRDMVHRVISSCPICPQVRLSTKPHGHLAPREAPIAPWSKVHVDCIGPWTVTVNNVTLHFEALTCIDPVTNLVEISRFQGPKTSDTARALFENQWLARYPHPLGIVHDNGPEFTGHDFQFPLDYAGITPVRITPYTPTANAVIESVHHTIGQVIRTLIHLKPPQNTADADSVVDEAIATAMHACRCAPNTSLGNFTPGALVFQRDMLLDLPLVADLLTLTQHRQVLIDHHLLCANA